MSDGYVSPAVDAWGQQRAREAAQAEARRRPRTDWTDLTFDEFQRLTGQQRQQLHTADPDRYRSMAGQVHLRPSSPAGSRVVET